MLRYRPSHQPASRYGMSAVNLTKSIKLISSEGSITIEGFSAHLSGYNVSERRNVGVSLIEFCKLARNSGHHPSCIDLGGGWPVSYVSMDDWQHFTSINHPDLYHTSKNFSQFYPYACEKPGAEALDECLNSPSVAGGTLSTLLLDNNLSLVIEPGRALLDQCGLTLFQINNIKTMPENYSIINVRGQNFSLSEQWFGSEFLPDPVLLKHHPKVAKNNLKQNHVACVAGSSCLEADMLTWRKINFPDEPVAGDILAYINTAGYQMDSNETSFHRTPLPAKIAIWQQNKAYQWCLDSQFKNLTSQALSEEYP